MGLLANIINPDDPYGNLSADSVFDKNVLVKIQRYAEGLSQEEVMAMFGIPALDALNPDDQRIFVYACTNAKLKGLTVATGELFTHMKVKGTGLQASLAYLYRYGKEWDKSDGVDDKPVKFEIQLSR